MEHNSNIGKLGTSAPCTSWNVIKYYVKCTPNFSSTVRVMAEILCTGTLRTLTFKWVTYMDENVGRLVGEDGNFLHNSCSIGKLLNIFNDILRACNEI